MFRRSSFSSESFKDDSFEFGDDLGGTAQGQTTSATGTVSAGITGAATTGQSQTVEVVGAVGIVGSAATGQGQATDGQGFVPVPITGTADTGQGQTAQGRAEVVDDDFIMPMGVGADARIAARKSESDTFVPADVLAMRRFDEDEILLVMIARAVTSGALNQWH